MRVSFLSIVMPVYNGERFLAEAIESILGQTYGSYEFLIVDDGSTDHSPEIAHEYAGRDKRIRVLSAPHSGTACAMNLGLAEARADWIARMDADDVCDSARFERQVGFLSRCPEVAVLGTYGWRISQGGRVVGVYDQGPRSLEEFEEWRKRGQLMWVIHPSVLMSRRRLEEVGGYRDMPHEDLDLFERIADRHPVLALPRRLIKIRIGHGLTLKGLRRQALFMDYLKSASSARRSGRPEPPLAEFESSYFKRLGTLGRFREYLRYVSLYNYRMGAQHLADRRWVRGAARLWLSVLARPSLPWGRLRQQVLPLLRARATR